LIAKRQAVGRHDHDRRRAIRSEEFEIPSGMIGQMPSAAPEEIPESRQSGS
jgi:hypothetical protein